MNQLDSRKLKCLYCGKELATEQEQCLRCKQEKRFNSFCCTKAVMILSSVVILLSLLFWAEVFVSYKHYPTFHNMTYILAAWGFFVGCYCFVLTYAQVYKRKSANLE